MDLYILLQDIILIETMELGHGRRADIVMLDDNLNVHNTWLEEN